jgi:hypothetical protein
MFYSLLRYAHCSNSDCPAHCKRSYPLQKMGDGRCHFFFAAPVYTVQLGVKRSVKSQAGRATSSNALCGGFDPCRQRPRDVAVDFGPKQSGWLMNQLGKPSLKTANPASARSWDKTTPFSDFLTFWNPILAESGGGLSRP